MLNIVPNAIVLTAQATAESTPQARPGATAFAAPTLRQYPALKAASTSRDKVIAARIR